MKKFLSIFSYERLPEEYAQLESGYKAPKSAWDGLEMLGGFLPYGSEKLCSEYDRYTARS